MEKEKSEIEEIVKNLRGAPEFSFRQHSLEQFDGSLGHDDQRQDREVLNGILLRERQFSLYGTLSDLFYEQQGLGKFRRNISKRIKPFKVNPIFALEIQRILRERTGEDFIISNAFSYERYDHLSRNLRGRFKGILFQEHEKEGPWNRKFSFEELFKTNSPRESIEAGFISGDPFEKIFEEENVVLFTIPRELEKDKERLRSLPRLIPIPAQNKFYAGLALNRGVVRINYDYSDSTKEPARIIPIRDYIFLTFNL